MWLDKLFRSNATKAGLHDILNLLSVKTLTAADFPLTSTDDIGNQVFHGTSRLVQLELSVCRMMTIDWASAGQGSKMLGRLATECLHA